MTIIWQCINIRFSRCSSYLVRQRNWNPMPIKSYPSNLGNCTNGEQQGHPGVPYLVVGYQKHWQRLPASGLCIEEEAVGFKKVFLACVKAFLKQVHLQFLTSSIGFGLEKPESKNRHQAEGIGLPGSHRHQPAQPGTPLVREHPLNRR